MQYDSVTKKNTTGRKMVNLFSLALAGAAWVLLFGKFIFYAVHHSFPSILHEQEDFVLVASFPLAILFMYNWSKDHKAEQNESYKMLFQQNPHAMWIYDLDTLKFLMVNDAAIALYGYRAEEFLGMSVSAIRAPEDVPALLNEVEKRKVDVDPYHWSGTWRHRKKNGEMIYAEVSTYKILFEGKNASLVLSYNVTDKVMQEVKLITINQELEQKVKDRTNDLLLLNQTLIGQNKTIKSVNHDLATLSEELKIANEKIKEHAELKSQFVSIVSHEFRTPLSTIRFAAEFLNRYHDRITTEQLLDKSSSISKQVAHMDALLDGVLTIGRTESVKIKTFIEPVDLKAFIKGIVSEVRASTNNTHHIAVAINGIPEKINSDEKLLRNIFINLLSNAIKYSGDEKTVFLNADGQGKEVSFKIKDQGIGIKAEDLPKIFEPFYRTTDVKSIQGSGLGLSIVKRAVELIGGNVSVESEVGKGSVFTVLLPAR